MKKIITFLILTLSLLYTFGCTSTLKTKNYSSLMYFNTATKALLLYHNSAELESIQKAWDEIKNKLENIDTSLSITNQNSDITKFNSSEKDSYVEVSKTTYDIMLEAINLYELTEGCFNPTMYYISDLWGFTSNSLNKQKDSTIFSRENYAEVLPDENILSEFKKLTDFSKVSVKIEEGKYYIYKPNDEIIVNDKKYTMGLDLGGITKGYATDEIKTILDKYKVDKGYISLGTSSLLVLNMDGKEDWTVNVTNPRNDSTFMQLKYVNTSISTSGDYENYFKLDGQIYSHIIDPKTCKPISNGMVASSIITESGIYSDGMSTAIMVMGKDTALDFLEDKDFDWYFVYYNNEKDSYEIYTNIKDKITLLDSMYTLQ